MSRSCYDKDDPYTWSQTPRSWRPLRLLHPFRGMYYDVRRRLPYYVSDIFDGLNYRTLAGTSHIFFINLLPALAFQLDMAHNTDSFFGINEALVSSALAAVVFSIFSAQPLTVVGVTGLISLFNYTIYDIIRLHDVSLYSRFLVWTGLWAATFHWAVAIFNVCDYMRTITDFSSETFGLYVGTIYVVKGCEELAINFRDSQIPNGFASALVAVLFFLTVLGLERTRYASIGTSLLRQVLSDYAYPIATIWWTGFTHLPGNLADVQFARLPISEAFRPTVDRPWVVDFWTLPIKWVFAAIPFGFLVTLLLYYDHNVSSLTAQARRFPLKKPAGFHWNFFLLGCTCAIAGVLNVPLPNGLVPQAPDHTDALTSYEEIITTLHPTDPNQPVQLTKTLKPVRVAEQRVSHFLMALMLIATMTGPLLTVLHTTPRAIYSGVFFTVGFGSILTNPIVTHKIRYLLTTSEFISPSEPLNSVSRRQISHYVAWQLFGWAVTVAVSHTIAAVVFPVLIIALVPLRWYILPRLFTRYELEIMDCLTADSRVVLCSLGGKPEMPELVLERKLYRNDPEHNM